MHGKKPTCRANTSARAILADELIFCRRKFGRNTHRCGTMIKVVCDRKYDGFLDNTDIERNRSAGNTIVKMILCTCASRSCIQTLLSCCVIVKTDTLCNHVGSLQSLFVLPAPFTDKAKPKNPMSQKAAKGGYQFTIITTYQHSTFISSCFSRNCYYPYSLHFHQMYLWRI